MTGNKDYSIVFCENARICVKDLKVEGCPPEGSCPDADIWNNME